jgi:hypothetical protein
MSKNSDPSASFDEKHFRVPELAETWGISRATLRTLIRKNPDVPVRYLPKSGNRKASRTNRTPLIPESSARELYLRLPRES